MTREGVCRGVLLREATGARGFGYDPIFQPDGHAVSMAELPSAEKNAIPIEASRSRGYRPNSKPLWPGASAPVRRIALRGSGPSGRTVRSRGAVARGDDRRDIDACFLQPGRDPEIEKIDQVGGRDVFGIEPSSWNASQSGYRAIRAFAASESSVWK